MLSLFMMGLIIWICFGMIELAVRLSWGLLRAFFAVLIMPGILVALILAGLIRIGLPLLIIARICMAFRRSYN